MKKALYVFAILFWLPAGSAICQTPNAAQTRFFETEIRPALVKYCYECHSVDAGDSRGGLLLDSRQGWVEGGDSGTAIVPGKLDESLFWQAINWDGYEMPPSKKMPAEVIAKFKQWIAMGAPDPRERLKLQFNTKIKPGDIEKGKEHWAFQMPKSESGLGIDSLVTQGLVDVGIEPNPMADPFTLLRRLNFDLIGLPPTAKEIQDFQNAFAKDANRAIDAKVKQLLRRPQYGERWGRHWLDVARYAESSGSRNFTFPYAWRYRDYVIDSFNDDTPYDRFIAEQIAGDLLPVDNDRQWQENLIATGFLAIGMKHLDQKNPRIFMADMIDEQIDTMTQAVLGLTVSCARCHDHKYDPIPTDDYYAMAGIFRSTKTLYGTQRVAQNHRPSGLLLLPILDKQHLSNSKGQSIASLKSRLEQTRRQMSEMGGRRAAKSSDKNNQTFKALMRNAQRIEAELARLNPDGSQKTFGMGVQEADKMVNATILLGGEVDRPAQEVPRGFVQILGDLNFTTKGNQSSGRRELVKSMTSKNNPLTARVMVNRIWMHLFGKPLVETPNNFGLSGIPPKNQQLLDYLAVRFMEKNWSVKAMIQEIVMSKTYQRSSKFDESKFVKDPENKLLWRANPRQLDAESLRDAMLVLSGKIDLKRPRGSAIAERGDGKPGGANIDPNVPFRSVYLPVVRDELLEPLELFDFPDANITSAGRSESIVPTQALYMMNGEFVTQQAQAMAAKLEQNYSSLGDQVRAAFVQAYARPATQTELKISAEFFKEFKPSGTLAPATSQRPPAYNRSGKTGKRSKGGNAKGNGKGNGKGNRRGRQNGPTQTRTQPVAKNQTLAVFCQTLIASARFRILN